MKRDASPQELKQAFRELAFQFHPDRNPHNPQAEEKFKEIARAYAALSGNEELFFALEKPQAQAQELRKWVDDIFGDIFGFDPKAWKARGKDLHQVLSLDAQEAYDGCVKILQLPREKYCKSCEGLGFVAGSGVQTCSYCFGLGKISYNQLEAKVDKICPQCKGLGKLSSHPCEPCRGRGVLLSPQKIKLQIPSCLKPVQEIRWKGWGSLADQSNHPGDLIVQVKVKPSKTFAFDGGNILCEVSPHKNKNHYRFFWKALLQKLKRFF